jgi:N6-adenosine-specific RNA methylase IME4
MGIMQYLENDIKKQEWYQNLVDDCQTIMVERGYRARMEVIEGYHELGERICTDINFKKYAKGRGEAVNNLAKDIGLSSVTLYFTMQFYDRWPVLSNALETFKEGKNISWHKIVNKYLPAPKKEIIILPKGKYNVIYTDPPWEYGDKLIEGYGAAEHHYRPMTINEIIEYTDPNGKQIKELPAEDAVLFLWVTSPILPECFPIIEGWGFKYATSFVWDKVKHNWGHYNSVRHEFLLICIKGTFLPESKELHDSVISIERSEEHSEKPEYFRDEIIEKMYPRGKWIELFARYDKEKREELEKRGWTLWGAQV